MQLALEIIWNRTLDDHMLCITYCIKKVEKLYCDNFHRQLCFLLQISLLKCKIQSRFNDSTMTKDENIHLKVFIHMVAFFLPLKINCFYFKNQCVR